MLKQIFDQEQLTKVLSPSDILKWNLIITYGSVEKATKYITNYWALKGLQLSPLKTSLAKRKNVFCAASTEDHFAIRLLDRFIRRIYKVRQSDRHRIIKQIKTLLKDSGDHHILRLDIKDCYESIKFQKAIDKLNDDLILSPECLRLLKDIHSDLKVNHKMYGLPRGLAISPTLAELYLEELDKKIALNPNVLYYARYVDDMIIFISKEKKDDTLKDIYRYFNEMALIINNNKDKFYSASSKNANFTFLGYSLEVEAVPNKANKVNVTISTPKINAIKTRIIKCLSSNRRSKNLALLKRRIEYISMLKVVKKGKNGKLFAGIAHNYQLVSDDFNCLKVIDGFFQYQLKNPRFGLSLVEQEKLKKISIYSNVKNMKTGNFTHKKVILITRIWNNA